MASRRSSCRPMTDSDLLDLALSLDAEMRAEYVQWTEARKATWGEVKATWLERAREVVRKRGEDG